MFDDAVLRNADSKQKRERYRKKKVQSKMMIFKEICMIFILCLFYNLSKTFKKTILIFPFFLQEKSPNLGVNQEIKTLMKDFLVILICLD